MWHVGDVIRKRRIDRGWTAERLAKKARIGVMTLSGIERGKGNARQATLERIAKALDTELQELYAELAATAGNAAATDQALTPDDLTKLWTSEHVFTPDEVARVWASLEREDHVLLSGILRQIWRARRGLGDGGRVVPYPARRSDTAAREPSPAGQEKARAGVRPKRRT